MLKVTNIEKTFKGTSGLVTAVKNVSLQIESGQFVAVVGRSGSGKSTLISLLGALEKPTSGTIELDGQDITRLSDHALIKYRCSKIGFVFQGYNLIPNLTALENVLLAMEFNHLPKSQRMGRAQDLLDQVGLHEGKQQRRPANLSGGEQQRVAIARALANNPELILADEPTGNLDSQTGQVITDLLRDLSRSNHTTVMVVTHDLALAKLTDKVFTLSDGELVSGKAK
jgi:putative ABC transport system ATP-binding protein